MLSLDRLFLPYYFQAGTDASFVAHSSGDGPLLDDVESFDLVRYLFDAAVLGRDETSDIYRSIPG